MTSPVCGYLVTARRTFYCFQAVAGYVIRSQTRLMSTLSARLRRMSVFCSTNVPLLCTICAYVTISSGLMVLLFVVCYTAVSSHIYRLLHSDNVVDINNVVLANEVYVKRISSIIDSMKSQNPVFSDVTKLTSCPTIPVDLEGPVDVNVSHSHDDITFNSVIRDNKDIQYGGKWQPSVCRARYRVAIIIPYRDRLQHLAILLSHLFPVLRRQQLNFRVFVVEQYGNGTFNKGRIMNAAFKEALKLYDFQCIVFHDVDLVPEDDRNMYTCPWQPRHMSVAIDEHDYRLKYDILVGGVLNMRVEHYQRVNGYSNMYWGWGAEDDDMAYRILHVGLKISRPPSNLARYKMIKHQKRRPAAWITRSKLLHTAVKRYKLDGLNSVKYKLIFIHEEILFTHIMVDVGKP